MIFKSVRKTKVESHLESSRSRATPSARTPQNIDGVSNTVSDYNTILHKVVVVTPDSKTPGAVTGGPSATAWAGAGGGGMEEATVSTP